jgi:hypothetical protein
MFHVKQEDARAAFAAVGYASLADYVKVVRP